MTISQGHGRNQTVKRKIAIVGGGISGLVCAYKLAQATAQDPNTIIHVLEQSDSFGGKIRTSSFAGQLVDEGPDTFLARKPAVVDLCKELGIGDQLVSPSSLNPLLLSDDRLHPFPSPSVFGVPTSARELFKSSAISTGGALRAMADFFPRLRRGTTSAWRPSQDQPTTDVSVAHATKALGAEVSEKFIESLIGGINAGRIENLSALSTAPQIAALSRGRRGLIASARSTHEQVSDDGPVFLAPSFGMSTLTNSLVSRLVGMGVQLRNNLTVQSAASEGVGWILTTQAPGQQRSNETFDAIVFATPAYVTAGIVDGVDSGIARKLDKIEYASVAIVRLAYKRKHISHDLQASGYLSVPNQRHLFTAASFSSSKWEHLAKNNTVILRLSAGRIDDDRAMRMSDARLITEATKELAFNIGASNAPLEADVIRWPGSFPQYAVGHGQMMDEIENAASKHRGLFIIGAATYGLGIASCVASATLGANRLSEQFGLARMPDTTQVSPQNPKFQRR